MYCKTVGCAASRSAAQKSLFESGNDDTYRPSYYVHNILLLHGAIGTEYGIHTDRYGTAIVRSRCIFRIHKFTLSLTDDLSLILRETLIGHRLRGGSEREREKTKKRKRKRGRERKREEERGGRRGASAFPDTSLSIHTTLQKYYADPC